MSAEYFSGRVSDVVFENPSQNFYIVRMVLDSDTSVADPLQGVFGMDTQTTVRGTIAGLPIQTGTWFGFEGRWVNHPKYGRQIEIRKAPVLKNGWDYKTTRNFLEASGVDWDDCEVIFKIGGEDGFLSVVEDVARLATGFSMPEAQRIHERWVAIKAYFHAMDILRDLNLPQSRIKAIWNTFGDDTEKVLVETPWRLVRVDGITFQQADEVALRMGKKETDPGRAEGATLFVSKAEKAMGHLYLTAADVIQKAHKLLPLCTKGELRCALDRLIADQLLIAEDQPDGTQAIYEPWFHFLEVESAKQLLTRIDQAVPPPAFIKKLGLVGPKTADAVEVGLSPYEIATTAVQEWSDLSQMVLSAEQFEGVINALLEPVSVLTGLPGTGKTTSLRAVVKILQDAEVSFLLIAPTGIASKRMSQATAASAFTIHRAFEARGSDDEDGREKTYFGIVGSSEGVQGDSSGEVWNHNKNNPHPADVVIVDESSMLDQHLLYRILECTKDTCRIVFVGDAAQLPSVGPGNVLRTLVASGLFATETLTTIFRQDEASDIILAAHAMHTGQVPIFNGSKEFILVEFFDEMKVLEVIAKLSKRLFDQRELFQVISPRHAGVLGVTNLNAVLRELLNPASSNLQEMTIGKQTIREDDRVMVVKNNYHLKVFNGDVGKIAKIDRGARRLEVRIHGDVPYYVTFKFSEVPVYLRMAYACTVHKFQGLEIDNIIAPIVGTFGNQLQRNLYYTAITRARKRVFLVGTQVALGRAVANSKEDSRNTLFLERLAAAC